MAKKIKQNAAKPRLNKYSRVKTDIQQRLALLAAAMWLSFTGNEAMAQTSGSSGINTALNTATTNVSASASGVSKLILAIGGVVGLVGGIRIYIKWNNGEHDINKELMGWGGACLFLLLVGTVINAFFGVQTS